MYSAGDLSICMFMTVLYRPKAMLSLDILYLKDRTVGGIIVDKLIRIANSAMLCGSNIIVLCSKLIGFNAYCIANL